jgi:amidophosphoribosyltransferase
VRAVNPRLTSFEASCFDGRYITGDITPDYLSHLAAHRDERRDTADMLEEAKLEVASGEPLE